MRRTTVALIFAGALTPSAAAQLQLSVQRVFPSTSLFVTSPPGDRHRLFNVAQSGLISVIKDGVVLPVFLNLQGTVINSSEAGLLGLAFHPQFDQNGYFYVFYSGAAGSTIARYSLDPANPDRADPASALILLRYQHSGLFHWGGWIGFGPDGYLYIASGNAGGFSNSQPTNTLLGKVLRIDVDHDDFPADPNRNYAIPPTNPFFGSATSLPEIWATGLRNPWRCSFDRSTGDLWIGDVGDFHEEIDFQPASGNPPFTARNYGYPCMDGATCGSFPFGCTCGQPGLILPIVEYQTHIAGNAVIGGYVYRGTRIPELQGAYVFGDLSAGVKWTYRSTATGPQVGTISLTLPFSASLNSFGEDADGELYACTQFGLLRLIPFCPANCDNSFLPPLLNANDFQCFLNKFAAGDSYANCDGSTQPPTLNVNDFACFINVFAAGCS